MVAFVSKKLIKTFNRGKLISLLISKKGSRNPKFASKFLLYLKSSWKLVFRNLMNLFWRWAQESFSQEIIKTFIRTNFIKNLNLKIINKVLTEFWYHIKPQTKALKCSSKLTHLISIQPLIQSMPSRAENSGNSLLFFEIKIIFINQALSFWRLRHVLIQFVVSTPPIDEARVLVAVEASKKGFDSSFSKLNFCQNKV